MGKKKQIVGLFSRQLGIATLKGILEDDYFSMKAVVTHTYEMDMKTVRPLFFEFVDICETHAIPLLVVNQNQNNLEILKEVDFDFLVSNCYKYILPSRFLSLANIASLNMHRSLLPKYKGLKPLQRALENRETITGTTIHVLSEKIDGGLIVDSSQIPIEPEDTVNDLFLKLYPTQYPLLKNALKKYEKKT